MSKLADATICPDCRAPLDAGSTCSGCGLPLAGESGERLWQTMLFADRLIEEIRANLAVTAAAKRPMPLPPHPIAPMPPVRQSAPPARRVPAFSVPVVLLSLGALCMLVAAVVFVAVTWGSLGLAGRTLVLGGVTGVFGLVAVTLTRRDLRGAAETFWVVVAAMLTIDLLAGRAAGLAGLDTLSWRGAGVLVGSALFFLGVLGSLWSRRTPLRRVWSLEGIAITGATLAVACGAWTATNPAVATATVVPVLALAALVLRTLPSVSVTLCGLLGVSWLLLAGAGLARASEVSALGDWWGDLRGWPLVVAAAYAIVAARLSSVVPLVGTERTVLAVRVSLLGLALALLAVLANAPFTEGFWTRDRLLQSATLIALALIARFGTRAWALAAAALALPGVGVLVLRLVTEPWASVVTLPSAAAPDLQMVPFSDHLPPWLSLMEAAVAVLAVLATTRLAPGRYAHRVRDLALSLSVSVLAAGAAVTVIAVGPALWTAVLALLVAAGVIAGTVWSRRRTAWIAATATGAAASGYLVVMALAVALPSSLVTAVAATVVMVVLAAAFAVSRRGHDEVGPALTAGLAVLAGAHALPAWCSVWQLADATTAVALAAYAGVVSLAAAPLARHLSSRLALELAAVIPAMGAVVLAPTETVVAMVLSVLAGAVAVLSVVNRDRAGAAWAAATLLVPASLLRLPYDGERPELWVVPILALLLSGGLWRRREGGSTEGRHVGSLLGAGASLGYLVLALLAVSTAEPAWIAIEATILVIGLAGVFAVLESRVQHWLTAPVAALVALSGGLAVDSWSSVLSLGDPARCVVLAVYAALVALAAAPCTRTAVSRLTLEGTALVLGLASLVLAPVGSTTAMVLTVLGSAAAILAVLHRDRQVAGWLGAVLLGGATYERIVADVQAPELYTLPAALLLLAAGGWRLNHDRSQDSFSVLGSGLVLALLPSLLLALQEPVSVRALLLGVGSAALLAYGVRERLAAPFVLAAGTLALLAVRHLEPVTEAVPRWATLGLLGVALLAVGITWEARLRNLQSARRYLVGLR